MGVRSNLKVFRNNRGFTVRQLGEAAGIPFGHVSAFENGRMNPTLDELERLCKALHVTPEDIYPDPAVRNVVL
jgi:transcriptional regulator with XRE-family HTH domain